MTIASELSNIDNMPGSSPSFVIAQPPASIRCAFDALHSRFIIECGVGAVLSTFGLGQRAYKDSGEAMVAMLLTSGGKLLVASCAWFLA
jgi:hypothetical protein